MHFHSCLPAASLDRNPAMTAVAPPPVSPPTPATSAKAPANRRSRSEEANIVRAKNTLRALTTMPAILAGVAKKDANAKNVRIDQGWVTQYASVISGCESSSAGRAVGRADLKQATASERASGAQLATILKDVREVVATHNPDDTNAQKTFGRGTQIEASRTGPTIALADTFLAAWNGNWKQVAADSGVTQATMDQMKALRDSLSGADMGQHGVVTANSDGTLQRAALFTVLRSMSTFATRVVDNVFGKTSSEAKALTDTRPLTRAGAAKKAAAKAKTTAKKAAAKAKKAAKPKNEPAAVKRRAKHAAVAARVKAVKAGAKPAAKAAPRAKAKPKKAKARK